MRKLILCFILLAGFIYNVQAQDITDCQGGIHTVAPITCSGGFLTFTVSSIGNCTNIIYQLPAGTTSPDGSFIGNDFYFYGTSATLTIPSANCAPVPIMISLSGGTCQFCAAVPYTIGLAAPIPTLSDWMLIVLLFSSLIIGVVFIRSRYYSRDPSPAVRRV